MTLLVIFSCGCGKKSSDPGESETTPVVTSPSATVEDVQSPTAAPSAASAETTGLAEPSDAPTATPKPAEQTDAPTATPGTADPTAAPTATTAPTAAPTEAPEQGGEPDQGDNETSMMTDF